MTEGYFVPAEMMEKIDAVLKFYAACGSWHYSDREMRPQMWGRGPDTVPLALKDMGKHASELYGELVKLYPLPKIERP